MRCYQSGGASLLEVVLVWASMLIINRCYTARIFENIVENMGVVELVVVDGDEQMFQVGSG